MFFVRGLSSNGHEVFINPDQVLYVRPAGFLRRKTALVLTYSERLIVDQNTATVRQRFEDYLRDITESREGNGRDDEMHPSPGEHSLSS